MANTVEVIFKAIDKFSNPIKAANDRLSKMKSLLREVELNMGRGSTAYKKLSSEISKLEGNLKSQSKSTINLGAVAGIATGILYGMAMALQRVADRAAEIGRPDVQKSFQGLSDQVTELGDQLLTISIGGGNALDALKGFADGLTISLRAAGVVIEVLAARTNKLVLFAQRLTGVLAEATGQTTQYTHEWWEAADAQNAANFQMRVGVIWEGKLTEALNKTGKAAGDLTKKTNAQNKAMETARDAGQAINDMLNQRRAINDAIRAGDARAIVAAKEMSGSGLSSVGRSGSGAGGAPGGGRPANGGGMGGAGATPVTVNVIVDKEIVRTQTRKVIDEEVFKPTYRRVKSG